MTIGSVPATAPPAIAGMVEALVFREILKPLAAGLGPVAESALSAVADTLFARPA